MAQSRSTVSPRQQKKRWDEARPAITKALAKAISDYHPKEWIDVGRVLPEGVNSRSFAQGMWSKRSGCTAVGATGSESCPVGDELIMLRHKFGCKIYLWADANTFTETDDREKIIHTIALKEQRDPPLFPCGTKRTRRGQR